MTGNRLAAKEGSLQIDVQHAVERLFVEVEEVRLVDDTGIVDEDIDVAELVERCGEEVVDMQPVGDVADDRPDLAEFAEFVG